MDFTKLTNTVVFLTTMFTFIVIGFLISCTRSSDTFVFDIDMKIVSINGDCSLTNDKFHRPQLCNTILLQTLVPIDGDTLYRELNTCEMQGLSMQIDKPEWFYNHKVGDILHFDYLVKSKFFTIRNRKTVNFQ